METFEDVYKTICRVCLGRDGSGNMVSLLEKSSPDGLSCYGKAAGVFSNILISNDFLPSSMCRKCLVLLQQAIVFKKTCEGSQEQLEKLLATNVSSEAEFREKLVEYVLYTSILLKESPEKRPEKDSNEQLKTIPASERHSPGESSETYMDFTNTLSDDASDFHDNSFLKSEDSDHQSDDSITVKKEQTTVESNHELQDREKGNENENQLKQSKEYEEESIDLCLDAIESIINMDPKTLRTLNKRYKTKKKTRIKKETTNQGVRTTSSQENQPAQHICEICNKNYSSYTSLRIHNQRHTGLYSFVCEHCAKPFSTKAELQYHLSSSHGIGTQYICHECGWKAYRKFELTEHMRIHTGERPYACDKCGLSFRQRFVWQRHLSFHQEKTVQCKYCPKKFHSKNDVRAHSNNVHDRRYVFACNYCDVTYAKTVTVRRHMQDSHGVARQDQGKVTRISLDRKAPATRRKYRKRFKHDAAGVS